MNNLLGENNKNNLLHHVLYEAIKMTLNTAHFTCIYVIYTKRLIYIERLDSSAKYIYCPQRKSMAPYHLECVLFLKTNKTYWDASMCIHL